MSISSLIIFHLERLIFIQPLHYFKTLYLTTTGLLRVLRVYHSPTFSALYESCLLNIIDSTACYPAASLCDETRTRAILCLDIFNSATNDCDESPCKVGQKCEAHAFGHRCLCNGGGDCHGRERFAQPVRPDNEWMNEWTNGRMDEWTNERMNE